MSLQPHQRAEAAKPDAPPAPAALRLDVMSVEDARKILLTFVYALRNEAIVAEHGPAPRRPPPPPASRRSGSRAARPAPPPGSVAKRARERS